MAGLLLLLLLLLLVAPLPPLQLGFVCSCAGSCDVFLWPFLAFPRQSLSSLRKVAVAATAAASELAGVAASAAAVADDEDDIEFRLML